MLPLPEVLPLRFIDFFILRLPEPLVPLMPDEEEPDWLPIEPLVPICESELDEPDDRRPRPCRMLPPVDEPLLLPMPDVLPFVPLPVPVPP